MSASFSGRVALYPALPIQNYSLGLVAVVVALMSLTPAKTAHAQAFYGAYNGDRYSSGTTTSTVYQNFDNRTNNLLINAAPENNNLSVRNGTTLTQVTTALTSPQYFGFNATGAGASTTGAGTFRDNAAPYPDGYAFAGTMVRTGTLNGVARQASFTATSSGANPFESNMWIKGATESVPTGGTNGMWNVRAGQASFLGGYTNATSTGSITINFNTAVTSFGTLIGTNPGANLDVQIVGFSGATQIFSYQTLDILSSPNNPRFTGYASQTAFDRVVITGLNTSTGAVSNPYTQYPNGAFIALDQFEFGLALPEPGSVALLATGVLGGVGVVYRRKR